MNNNTIKNLLKIANILDTNEKYEEANILTKIAQDLSDEPKKYEDEIQELLDNTEGNFIALLSLPSKESFMRNNRNVIVSRMDEKVNVRSASPIIEFARRDFGDLKRYFMEKGMKFKTFDVPTTKEEERRFQRMINKGEQEMRLPGDREKGKGF